MQRSDSGTKRSPDLRQDGGPKGVFSPTHPRLLLDTQTADSAVQIGRSHRTKSTLGRAMLVTGGRVLNAHSKPDWRDSAGDPDRLP